MNTIEALVNQIEAATRLTFSKSFSGSNSFYCNERNIRVSDHYSKYTERMSNTFDDNTAIDLVINNKNLQK